MEIKNIVSDIFVPCDTIQTPVKEVGPLLSSATSGISASSSLSIASSTNISPEKIKKNCEEKYESDEEPLINRAITRSMTKNKRELKAQNAQKRTKVQ